MTGQPIETERLTLRPLAAADAETIVALAGDEDVARMTARIPHPYGLSQARDWIARIAHSREVVFAIIHGDSLIGCAGYMPERGGRAEIGYWIGKSYWNNGFAAEAARAVAQHAFETGGIGVLTSGHFRDNPASGRVLEKLGFTPTGERQLECAARGQQVACAVYRLERAGLRAA